ncbi:MAG: ABC transporter ATP-binding protein [bacterium]|nr:ABC transporter ATP-binding protein [bacterium]
MLRLKSINAYYGQVHVLKNVSLHVSTGEIVALLGANGAGKTTLLNLICGLIKKMDGEVFFEKQDITRLTPHRIVRCGISHVPEGRQVFNPLTVIDNLKLGAYQRLGRISKKSIEQDLETIFSLFPALFERRHMPAGNLSGGEAQMLAIGRALMASPKLLLLDEPSMGLAPKVVNEIMQVIAELRQRGTTILLVEQNAMRALRIADRAYVMETGKIVLQEKAATILGNQEIVRAYLGKSKKEIWE